MKHAIARYVIIILGITLLTGCAKQRNIPLSEAFWRERPQQVVVATVKAPTPQVYQLGEQGLLDLAINSAMNKRMNDALKRTDLSWYDDLSAQFVRRLQAQQVTASAYDKRLSGSKKELATVLAQIPGNKLLTLELKALGARRKYTLGLIPSAPEAYCLLVGKLVDATDNKKIWWLHEAEIIQPVAGAWDQPPSYPNFNRALQSTIEEARQELLDSFFSGCAS